MVRQKQMQMREGGHTSRSRSLSFFCVCVCVCVCVSIALQLASIALCVWGCFAIGGDAVAAMGRNAFARCAVLCCAHSSMAATKTVCVCVCMCVCVCADRRVDGRGRVSAFPFSAADRSVGLSMCHYCVNGRLSVCAGCRRSSLCR